MMTRVVRWDEGAAADLRVARRREGTIGWSEVRRNLFVPSRIGNLFSSGGDAAPKLFALSSVYRSFQFPVTPGGVYSLRRLAPFTNRFHVVFSELEPAQNVAWIGAKILNSTAETLENITAPAEANWMHVYLSSTSQEIPGLLVEESPVAGTYFDGDTNPNGEASRTRWVGTPGESESVIEDAVEGIVDTALSVSRAPTPAIFAPTGFHLREDGASFFGRGEDSLVMPASTIKMLTSYVARLYVTDDMLQDTVTVLEEDLAGGGSTADLMAGDVVTWELLFHGTLLRSGNDAAHTIARYAGDIIAATEGGDGGHTSFRAKANSFIEEWGWRGAVFVSASGADLFGRLSTRQLCELMFKLDDYTVQTSAVLSYPAVVTGVNARTWTMTHGLAARYSEFPTAISLKTGAIPSQEVEGVVCMFEINGVRHSTAVLGGWPAGERFPDTHIILDHAIAEGA